MENLGAQDPRWIGEYQLLGRLGEGGMGKVYLARSARGRTVAVKLVQPNSPGSRISGAASSVRWRRRRRVGGQWTAPVLDADTEAAVPWVATGYIGGPSLHAVVAEDFGALPEQSVHVLAHGLALALRDIHGAGLIHRDLKPSNILITIDGPRVIDFGIARALDAVGAGNSNLTQTGAVVGSPGFMSPEQVRGETVTVASDVFCLGSVLAFAATGRQPFGRVDSGIHALMYRIAQEEPDLEGLPEGLLGLVTACLSKDPAQRPSVPDLVVYAEAAAPDADPWLPGGLLARLGRDALQLLEAENPHLNAAGPASTPPPQSAYATPQAGPSTPPSAYVTPNSPSAYATPTSPSAYATPNAAAYPMSGAAGHMAQQPWQQGGGYQVPGQGTRMRSQRGLRNALLIVFSLWLALTVTHLALNASLLEKTSALGRPSYEGTDERSAVSAMEGMVGLSVTAIIVLWVIWFRRTYLNATVLAPGRPRFGSGYAVGAWFIPVAQLWIPKQIANDVWTHSAPPGPGRASRQVLHWWWTFFVLWFISTPISTGLLRPRDRRRDKRFNLVAQIVDDGIAIVAALLAMGVVLKLGRMQDKRRDEQRNPAGHVPAGVFGPPVSG